MSLTVMMKVYPPRLVWLAATTQHWTGSISHRYCNTIHSALQCCVCVYPLLSSASHTHQGWGWAACVAVLCIDSVGSGHTSSRVSAVNKSSSDAGQFVCVYVCVCVCLLVNVCGRKKRECLGLSQSSQREWKRQPHDNVTSPPFILATCHSRMETWH